MYATDMEEDPDKGVKEAFSEIREVVTGTGDRDGAKRQSRFLSTMKLGALTCRATCPRSVDR